ncbi:hypothetical protein BRADI_4g25938v3 [Brachypodium distachyon]|uniref:Uncharacterized protein n=1 Tax=Brachypodium distachyon TaxID=15368 RepID=A0A2K2CQC5_BRADI|nr:hypothetical protein BRADI_4g25938v3 [Brachypodium distachyon]
MCLRIALTLPSCHGVLYMPSKYSSKCTCCSTFDMLFWAALPHVVSSPIYVLMLKYNMFRHRNACPIINLCHIHVQMLKYNQACSLCLNT